MAFADDELSRLFLMMGLGTMGAQNPWQGISRGGMFALQDLDQQRELKAKQKLVEAKMQEEALQAEKAKAALDRQKQMLSIYAGGGQPPPAGSQRSVVDAPGWTPQVAPRSKDIGQMLLDAGFVKEAEDYAKARGALHGEAYGGLQVTQSGRPYYMTKQGPRYAEDNSFVPREELHFADIGDRSAVGLDKFTGAVRSQGVAKGMSPAERDAAARGWANFGLDKQKFDRGELRDVPMPDGSTGVGFVTPRGVNFVPGVGQKTERLHDSAAEKLLQLDTLMQTGQTALSELKSNGGTGPVIGRLPDFVANWYDQKGLKSRQFLSDLTTQITLARSGAAVTDAEYRRLEPFLATPKDTETVAQQKIENLLSEYQKIRTARAQFYASQGYRVPAQNLGLPGPLQGSGQIKSSADLERELLAELDRRKKK